MCGRFAQKSPARKISRQFKVEEVPPLVERYNVAPAQSMLAVREASDGREAAFLKWELVPRWAKEPKDREQTIGVSQRMRIRSRK